MIKIFIFLWKIHNLCDYSIYEDTINVFFASNLKKGRVLRSTILPTSCDPPIIVKSTEQVSHRSGERKGSPLKKK